MRILTWIIGLPVAAVAIAFAVANRQPVEIDLWPLPFTVQIGVYLAVLGALAAGLIFGCLIGWVSAKSGRADKVRAAQARARDLEREVDLLRSQVPNAADKALPAPDSTR